MKHFVIIGALAFAGTIIGGAIGTYYSGRRDNALRNEEIRARMYAAYDCGWGAHDESPDHDELLACFAFMRRDMPDFGDMTRYDANENLAAATLKPFLASGRRLWATGNYR